MDKISYEQMFDYLSDFFENVEWSRPTLIEVGNTLISSIAFDSNADNKKHTQHMYDANAVLSAKINALSNLVLHHNDIEDGLDYSPLIPYISSYDMECTDTVLYLLACTGDMKYMEIIEKEAARFTDIKSDEYKNELLFRAEKK